MVSVSLLVAAVAAGGGNCSATTDCNAAKCGGCACVSGKCVCAGGWEGPQCATPYCEVGSAAGCGNGTCVAAGGQLRCQCHANFTGFRCGEPVCALRCKHGTLPSPGCTRCGACVGGWTGASCDIWDSSMAPAQLKASYAAHLSAMRFNVMRQVQEVDSRYQPLPGWRAVAASVNTVTGQPATPFLEFDFTQAKFWTDAAGVNFSVPDAMQITSGFVPGAHPQPPVALLRPSSLVETQLAQIRAAAGALGFLGGLTDPDALLKAAFGHGVSLAVYTDTYPVYDLRVPNATAGAPVRFSRYARAAIESLPPLYDETTRSVFETFISIFGTGYSTTATYGGMNQTVLAWPSCLWKGAHPDPSAPKQCLLDSSNLAAHVAARDFNGETRTFAATRFGGDPSAADPAAWVKSIALNPVGIGFDTISLSSLLRGYNS